jgi:hypothetical protein
VEHKVVGLPTEIRLKLLDSFCYIVISLLKFSGQNLGHCWYIQMHLFKEKINHLHTHWFVGDFLKLVAKHSYRLILILLAISAVTGFASDNTALKDIVSVSVLVLVAMIALVSRKIDKEER